MSVEFSNGTYTALANALEEMGTLTSKAKFTTADEKRHNQLLMEVSLIKKGLSADEIRRFDQERLLKAAGMAKMPERASSKMDLEIDQEWRLFAKGQATRTSFIPEDRANVEGTQSITYTQLAAGSSFVPQGMYGRAYQTQKQYDQIFDDAYCNIVETPTGGNTAFPVWDDVSVSSTQIGETVQSNEVDVFSFGSTQLGAYTFRSGIVGVSLELLQDSNWPLGTVLERVFAFRHARGGGAALVNGSGTNAPMGLITGAVAAGATITVASGAASNDGGAETGATSIGTADLTKAYFSLNAAYRPGANWATNDSTLLALNELTDKYGRPIISWHHGPTGTDGEIPYLMGKPVAICPSFPTMSSGSNSVVFYNPLYFVQRRVPSATFVQRFSQSANLITYGLVGFQSYLRMSSTLVAPNSSFVPASIIQNHS